MLYADMEYRVKGVRYKVYGFPSASSVLPPRLCVKKRKGFKDIRLPLPVSVLKTARIKIPAVGIGGAHIWGTR
jgi:hypothetical protein